MKLAIKVYQKNTSNLLYTLIVPAKCLAKALSLLNSNEVSFLAVEVQ